MDRREIYREWLRELREDYREFGRFRADEIADYSSLDYHYNQFLIDLAYRFDESGIVDPFKYLRQAEEAVYKIKEKLTDKFDLIQSDTEENARSIDHPFLFDLQTGDEFETIGYKRRKRLFPTLADLVDYVVEVPYPGGVQIVKDEHGRIIGYYLWVEK